MFCIIVTFDNTDPAVYGPFATQADATAAEPKVHAKLVGNKHVESISIEALRSL